MIESYFVVWFTLCCAPTPVKPTSTLAASSTPNFHTLDIVCAGRAQIGADISQNLKRSEMNVAAREYAVDKYADEDTHEAPHVRIDS